MPRKKSVRVRTKLHIPPKSPTTPLLQPISVVKTVDCCLETTVSEPTRNNASDQVIETSGVIGKDANCNDVAPNTTGNVVIPKTRSRVLSHQKPNSVVSSLNGRLSSPVNEPTREPVQNHVLEASGGIGKDGCSNDFAPKTSGNMVVPDTSFCVLAPQMVQTKEDFIMMDFTEDEVCLKCGKGGTLLICSGNACSIAFHENCISLPHFDGAGNFCCPYCLYGQAKAEVRAARERVLLAKKALLIYMEKENNVNSYKRKNGISKGKEHCLSTGSESSGCDESSHRMKSNNTGNQTGQREKTPKGVSVVFTINRSASKEIDMPVLDKKDDGFRNHAAESQSGQPVETPNGVDVVCATNTSPSLGIDTDGCRDSATQNQLDHQVVLVEEHTHLKLTVACDGVRPTKKRKSSESVSMEVGNTVNVEFNEEYTDIQCDGAIKDQQQAGNSRASPMQGEMTLTSELNLSEKELGKNAEPREVNGTKRIKTEQMQEHVQETTLAFTVLEPSFQVHEELDKGLETTGSIVEDNETVAILRRHMRDVYKQHPAQPQTVNPLRWMLPLDIVTSKAKGDQSLCIKSRQIDGPYKPSMRLPCLGGRRIIWTDEEEEMLKAGVERFSQTINKNLPWKKILEFGRGVFAVSRTPSDLKDKWRNILAKEHSSK